MLGVCEGVEEGLPLGSRLGSLDGVRSTGAGVGSTGAGVLYQARSNQCEKNGKWLVRDDERTYGSTAPDSTVTSKLAVPVKVPSLTWSSNV